MQVPFEIKKAALQKALGIGAASGAAFAAAGLFDPEEGEAATFSDMRKVVQEVNRATAKDMYNIPWNKKTFGKVASSELRNLKKIPEETLSDISSFEAKNNLGDGRRGLYRPVNQKIEVAKDVLTEIGPSKTSPGATDYDVLPNLSPASVVTHEANHHWQYRHNLWPLNITGDDDPYVMAHFLPRSVIPEVLSSKTIPDKMKNKVVDVFHSLMADPKEVGIAIQELSTGTNTRLHTPGELLAAVYDSEVMGKWDKMPTAKKYFGKLGKYMIAVPSVAALAVGIDTALQATGQGSTADAMPKPLWDAATKSAIKVQSGALGKGGQSGVMGEAWQFTFPAGLYKDKTVDNIVKSKTGKTFYLAFTDKTVGRLDEEEAKLLSQNIGIGRYLDIWDTRSSSDKMFHAKKIAGTKATRNALLAESEGGVPPAAEATPIETLEKVHKMGLNIKPYKQVEYRGQIFDLPTQYANLLLAENVVTTPGLLLTEAPKKLSGAERALRAKGLKPAGMTSTEPWAGFEDRSYPVNDLVKSIETQNPGVQIDIASHINENTFTLSRLWIPPEKRKTGLGQKIIKQITDFADKYGIKVEAHGNDKLLDYYTRYGFVKDKSRGMITRTPGVINGT